MLPRYLLIARINRRLLGAARIVTNRASKSTRTPESVSRSIRVVRLHGCPSKDTAANLSTGIARIRRAAMVCRSRISMHYATSSQLPLTFRFSGWSWRRGRRIKSRGGRSRQNSDPRDVRGTDRTLSPPLSLSLSL